VVEGVVGRRDELEALQRFLEQPAARGPRALVLEGEAGIGKSTLWTAGVARARAAGFRVLESRPTEAESGLAFAVLADLLEGVAAEVLPTLSPPRRRALEAALLLSDESDPVDSRAIGAAVRSSLETLCAEDTPVLLAIDDVQWIDGPTAAALAFAVRRVETPLVLLLARRVAEGVQPSPVESAVPEASLGRLPVGPLRLGAVQLLLRERLARVLSRSLLLRVHDTSGGNPFYALELAAAVDDDIDAAEPLPVPATLEGLVQTRLAELPASTSAALLLVAAHGPLSAETLHALGVEPEDLDPAVSASIVEVERGVTQFTHPLLASVCYQTAADSHRLEAHARLAAVVWDPLDRARQLARSTQLPDSTTATEIESAAGLALARGAVSNAVELYEQALRLTPASESADLERRLAVAARANFGIANVGRARALADDLLARARSGRPRVETLLLVADLQATPADISELRRQALAEAEDDPWMKCRIHQWLGWNARFSEGLEIADEHARSALELAERLDDDEMLAGALAAVSAIRFHLGEPDAIEVGDRALELAQSSCGAERLTEIALTHSSTLLWTGELERAEVILEAQRAEWADRDETVISQVLWRLAFVDVARGRLASAAAHAEAAREIVLQYGETDDALLWAVAYITALRGDLEVARALAEQGAAAARDRNPWMYAYFEGVLGQVELWRGAPAEAVARFAVAERSSREIGSREPSLARWRADHVEALLELGRGDDALELLVPWEEAGTRLGRAAVVAQTTRCRGLLAAAGGDIGTARALLSEAADRHAAIGDRLGQARALLALGVVSRRARQQRLAREALEEAALVFEDCGAGRWATAARAEVGSIGGRRRVQGLTAAEQRVAALVSEGRTNREVADELFLGVRTVESHLTHIYSKLGVRSRTELARTYAARP
jgi:DNA-binding CsgD family transcriptional regulator